tara:strand:+ start:101649 stop:101777 length:129 start_codon:yes stop_codon:yes gene_type:complete
MSKSKNVTKIFYVDFKKRKVLHEVTVEHLPEVKVKAKEKKTV